MIPGWQTSPNSYLFHLQSILENTPFRFMLERTQLIENRVFGTPQLYIIQRIMNQFNTTLMILSRSSQCMRFYLAAQT
jgi:hypothetical protein